MLISRQNGQNGSIRTARLLTPQQERERLREEMARQAERELGRRANGKHG